VALRLGAIALTRGRGAGIEGEAVTMLTSPWQKMPPGPDYVLFFGAGGLCMAAAVTQLRALRAGRMVTGWFETLGRNSAVVFIVQFYVYALILPLAFPFVPGLSAAVWPVAFVATVASLVLFAREWEARRLNRLLTVQPMLRLLPADRSRTALAMGVAALLLVLTARLNTLVKASPLLPHGRASAHVHTTASLRS
jgi:hypothetical protein